MAHQSGARAPLLIGFEPTFGTLATTGIKIPFNSDGLKGSQELNQAGTMTGRRDPTEPFLGKKGAEGPLTIPLDSTVFWYLAKAMFGVPVTTGADPYVHEFKIGDTMPSLSIEKGFPDLTTDRFNQFLGCKADSFGINIGGSGELVADMGFFGAEDQWAASSMDASPAEPTLSRVHNSQAVVAEGGATSSIISKLSLNLNFGLDKRDDLILIGGGGVRGSIPEGIVGVSGAITAIFDDAGYTLLQKGVNNTESSLKVTMTAGASSVVEFEIEELFYSRESPVVAGPQGLLTTLNFQGFFGNGSEDSAFVCRITNSDEHSGGI